MNEAKTRPEILAPAGDEKCFLAALAAGADAIYVGLKHFSARMQAENFTLAQLAKLAELAHAENARVYVAMNTLVKPGEVAAAYRLIRRLASDMEADGLIIQDLGMIDLARQAGFRGGLFLSTLANVSNPQALSVAAGLGASRVIVPRELSIDELRDMGKACPAGLGLECFVHGALCYCVSGRCYWSSYMGGKSGLRGRCVQPCRRAYRPGGREKNARSTSMEGARHFSTRDLSIDVLAKTLLDIPNLDAWKIEGRKKGPHYVYHVVTAYRMLRDNPRDAAARRAAGEILESALGRPATRARFLPQKDCQPVDPSGLASSGKLVGKIFGEPGQPPAIRTRQELLAGDYLRVGVEDERWHTTLPVSRRVPKGGRLALRVQRHRTPPAGTLVFLIDRRSPELADILGRWSRRLAEIPERRAKAASGEPRFPASAKRLSLPDIDLRPTIPRGPLERQDGMLGLWLSRAASGLSRTLYSRISWWLPPVIWPDEEAAIAGLVRRLLLGGARHFVLNAPWQTHLFAGVASGEPRLIAGPFCNAANAFALHELKKMGFRAAFVSPELSEKDYLALPPKSPLPLGLVLEGNWPVGISRFGLAALKNNDVFSSPRGEMFWARKYGQNTWIYPAWPLRLGSMRQQLKKAGYGFFASMPEKAPSVLAEADNARPGLFNWESGLL